MGGGTDYGRQECQQKENVVGISRAVEGGLGHFLLLLSVLLATGMRTTSRRRKEAGLYCRYLLPGFFLPLRPEAAAAAAAAAAASPSRQTAGGTIYLIVAIILSLTTQTSRVGLPVAAGSAVFDDDDDGEEEEEEEEDDAPGHGLSFASPMLGGFRRIWCWRRRILRWCRGIRTVPA